MQRPNSRQLILLRHAQAASQLSVEDRERPLTEKGQRQANQMAGVLAQYALCEFEVYVSPSKRTLQTAQIICQYHAIPSQQIKVVAELYDASVETLLSVLQSTPDTIRKLWVIGHNPSLTEVLFRLMGPQQATAAPLDLKPASVAVLTISGSWQALQHVPITLDSLIDADG